jgi:hypothetical protein
LIKKREKILFQNLLSNAFLQSAIFSVIACIIEYGIFQKTDSESTISPAIFIITLFLSVFFVTSVWKTIGIRINQQSYFREDFAFHASYSIFTFVLIGILSFFTRLMLWNIFEQITKTLIHQSSPIRNISLLDYFLWIAVTINLCLVASQWHKQWNGCKSAKQYRQEQNSEYAGFWAEGVSEFQRRCIGLGQSPLISYIDESQTPIKLQITPQETLAWKERAKELIRLSSSSYAFDTSSSWHDRAGCWVGENVDTAYLVFLYPVQTNIEQDTLEKFEQYAEQVAKQKNKKMAK